MLLIVVYVGAVAVLFLFVVMMLNVKNEEKNIKFQKYTPFTLFIITVVFIEILYIFVSDDVTLNNISLSENLSFTNNTIFLGNILYTDYFLLFQLSGIILLVAMIGAIILTLRNRTGVRKQVINQQISTSKADVIEIVKVKSGDGA